MVEAEESKAQGILGYTASLMLAWDTWDLASTKTKEVKGTAVGWQLFPEAYDSMSLAF